MATTANLALEIYLHSDFQPDAEFIDGEILERPAPEDDHSAWQSAICTSFAKSASAWNSRVRPSLRVQVTPEIYLVPDVSILDAANPREKTATRPPLAVFEVWSPENKVREMMRKLALYEQMGIPQIWVIDPDLGAFERYQSGHLVPATRFDQANIQFEMAEIATFLQAPGL